MLRQMQHNFEKVNEVTRSIHKTVQFSHFHYHVTLPIIITKLFVVDTYDSSDWEAQISALCNKFDSSVPRPFLLL